MTDKISVELSKDEIFNLMTELVLLSVYITDTREPVQFKQHTLENCKHLYEYLAGHLN